MIKIEQQIVRLKAGIPQQFFVKGGIDYYDIEIDFGYQESASGKQIIIALKSATGQAVWKEIQLDGGGYMPFQFDGELDMNFNRRFGFLELLSREDLNLEFVAEEPECAG